MDIQVETETTIKGGLPVRATGTVISCHPMEYPGRRTIEDLEISWLNGYPYKEKLSDADSESVCEDLFEAADRHFDF